jgi:hypothetical protein
MRALVQVRGVGIHMSIDKESDGIPEVNVHRWTTKVNLWMIVAILAFFIVAGAAAFRISQKTASPTSSSEKK